MLSLHNIIIQTKDGEITAITLPEGATVTVGYSEQWYKHSSINLYEVLYDRLISLRKEVE